MEQLRVIVVAFLLVSSLICSGRAAEWQYASRAGALLDLEVPSGAGPFPLIIAIHGGGWESETRADAAPFCRMVIPAGFACAAVDYRLAPRAQFPAPVQDIIEATAFLRRKADQLNIWPGKFILAGESAGGHLASLAAIRSSHEGGIAGVAVFSGPFDLLALSEPSRSVDVIPEQVSQLLGIHRWTPETIAKMKSASPVFLIDNSSPPFLVIRGAEDRLVPAAQSDSFCGKAFSVGVSCTITTISAAKHGLWGETEMDRFGGQWNKVLISWARKLVMGSTQ